MRRPSGDQLGLELIACVAPKESIAFPVESRRTISDLPRLCLTAAMREPSGDQRGSAHCTLMVVDVIGTDSHASLERGTNRVVAGSSCTATISPSARTSGAVNRAPIV